MGVLGEGNYGRVYLVINTAGTKYAVKQMIIRLFLFLC
jgi:serine/threonine protein kinase